MSAERFQWSQKSIAWYEEAARFTGYHTQILKEIQGLLRPGDRVLELACGTGAFARALAPLVKEVAANDLDPLALSYLSQALAREGPENVVLRPGNWKEVFQGETYDVVTFSYFSAFLQDWELLSSLALRHIIAVLHSETMPRRKAPAANTSSPGQEPQTVQGGDKVWREKRQRENYEDAARFLEERGVSYRTIPLTVDFGQPFASLEDAYGYFHHYYDLIPGSEQAQRFAEEKLRPLEGGGYYFPKIKRIGIVAADL